MGRLFRWGFNIATVVSLLAFAAVLFSWLAGRPTRTQMLRYRTEHRYYFLHVYRVGLEVSAIAVDRDDHSQTDVPGGFSHEPKTYDFSLTTDARLLVAGIYVGHYSAWHTYPACHVYVADQWLLGVVAVLPMLGETGTIRVVRRWPVPSGCNEPVAG